MKTFKKNQVIITALAIMIAVAGYINFTEKSNLDEDTYVFNPTLETGTEDSSDLVPNIEATDEQTEDANPPEDGETEDANPPEDGEATETVADNSNEDVGEAVLISSNSVGSNYFLESKISREQTRALSMEILLEVINSENLGEEQKIQAAAGMMNLQDRIEKEAAAEAILEAKGFKDVFVSIDNEKVDVVVSASTLSETELAQIADVVSRKTGYDPANIVINPLASES